MKYKRKHQSFLQANNILAAILQIFCNLEGEKGKWKSKNMKSEKHLTLDSSSLGCDYSGQIAACVGFF